MVWERKHGKERRYHYCHKDVLFLTFASVSNEGDVEVYKFLSKVCISLLRQNNKEDAHELTQHSHLGLKIEFRTA